MQDKELSRATTGVVSSIDMSGRTADEIKRRLRKERKRCFCGIASSAIPGYLMAVGLLVALLAPLSASADPGGIPGEIAALREQVASLQSTVSTLQEEIKSLQSGNTTLQKQLATVQSNHALLLGPFVTVDPNPEIGVIGPNIIFSGANIHIVSGSGATNDNGNPTGLGNLIIGYDEDPGNPTEGPLGPGPVGPDEGLPPPFPLQPGDRSGSHNLVIGSWHKFTRAASGGFVAGEYNVIGSEGASVSGGGFNTANGRVSSVSGGGFNTASGIQAVVTGGNFNSASGSITSVLGGTQNTADSNGHSIGPPIVGATVVGGEGNTASGADTVVIGGQNVTDNNDFSIAPKPPFP